MTYPEDGRCVQLGIPVEVMVPDKDDLLHGNKVEFAKSVCAKCPFKSECLADALSNPNTVGVWGGELFELPDENTAEKK